MTNLRRKSSVLVAVTLTLTMLLTVISGGFGMPLNGGYEDDVQISESEYGPESEFYFWRPFDYNGDYNGGGHDPDPGDPDPNPGDRQRGYYLEFEFDGTHLRMDVMLHRIRAQAGTFGISWLSEQLTLASFEPNLDAVSLLMGSFPGEASDPSVPNDPRPSEITNWHFFPWFPGEVPCIQGMPCPHPPGECPDELLGNECSHFVPPGTHGPDAGVINAMPLAGVRIATYTFLPTTGAVGLLSNPATFEDAVRWMMVYLHYPSVQDYALENLEGYFTGEHEIWRNKTAAELLPDGCLYDLDYFHLGYYQGWWAEHEITDDDAYFHQVDLPIRFRFLVRDRALLVTPNPVDFGMSGIGYEELTPRRVTVQNIGQYTELILGDGITIPYGWVMSTPIQVPLLQPQESTWFYIRPANNLPVGVYDAPIIVSSQAGAHGQTQALFEVVEPTISVTGDLDFGSRMAGYEALVPRLVTVTNTTDTNAGTITVTLLPNVGLPYGWEIVRLRTDGNPLDGDDWEVVTTIPAETLGEGESMTFHVRPREGLLPDYGASRFFNGYIEVSTEEGADDSEYGEFEVLQILVIVNYPLDFGIEPFGYPQIPTQNIYIMNQSYVPIHTHSILRESVATPGSWSDDWDEVFNTEIPSMEQIPLWVRPNQGMQPGEYRLDITVWASFGVPVLSPNNRIASDTTHVIFEVDLPEVSLEVYEDVDLDFGEEEYDYDALEERTVIIRNTGLVRVENIRVTIPAGWEILEWNAPDGWEIEETADGWDLVYTGDDGNYLSPPTTEGGDDGEYITFTIRPETGLSVGEHHGDIEAVPYVWGILTGEIAPTDVDGRGDTLDGLFEVVSDGGFSISGIVSAFNAGRGAEVRLIPADSAYTWATTPFYTVTVLPDDLIRVRHLQSFTLTNVPAGIYDLVVRKAAHTSFTITGFVVSEDMDYIPINGAYRRAAWRIDDDEYAIFLYAGDVDENGAAGFGSGFIGLEDLALIQTPGVYRKAVTVVADEFRHFDIDGDGFIGLADFAIARSPENFRMSSVVIPAPLP